MKIGIVTNYVVACRDPQSKSMEHYHSQAERFVSSYKDNFSTKPDRFVLVAAGGPLPDNARELYKDLATSVIEYGDGGWWEGELQFAAWANQDLDLMLCFICAIRFKGKGWFDRFVEAREKHGDQLFGAMGSYELHPHLRSCAIACSPKTILEYPYVVKDLNDAHKFEHGFSDSFTEQTVKRGKRALQVTWDGEYDLGDWRKAENVFRKGDQSNLLCWDHHADYYDQASDDTKAGLKRVSDGEK